jgi:DNA-binding NarL/FixJ family response regulator
LPQSQAGSIRVVVVDDHTILREPLSDFLDQQPGLTVVGDAADGAEAVRLVEALGPDVLLLDVVLGSGADEGLQVAEQLRQSTPNTRIIVLTGVENPQHAERLLEMGVAGYLPKSVSFDRIAAVIRSVHAGEAVFPPPGAAT